MSEKHPTIRLVFPFSVPLSHAHHKAFVATVCCLEICEFRPLGVSMRSVNDARFTSSSRLKSRASNEMYDVHSDFVTRA